MMRSMRSGGVHAAVGAVVLVIATVLLASTWRVLENDREMLVDRFAAERRGQLAEGARLVEEELADVADDLLFAGRLVVGAPTAEAGRHSLVALLRGVAAYRVAAIYDASCERRAHVQDPRWGEEVDRAFLAVVDDLAVEACQRGGDEVLVSTPMRGVPEVGWYRVFATRLPDGEEGAVALVVDTRPILERFGLITADPGTDMLVLGPHGMTTPVTSAALVDSVETLDRARFAVFGHLVDRMRGGEEGTVVLPREEARGLGLGDAPVVAVFQPIEVDGSRKAWSAATLVSTGHLRDVEARLVRRFGVAAGGMGALLLLFCGYIVHEARRDAATREALRQATVVAHLKERAERILDHVPDLVVALDPADRVTAVNAALRDLVGQSAAGCTLDELFPRSSPAARGVLRELLEQAAGGSVVRHRERLALFAEEGVYTVHVIAIRPEVPELARILVLEDLTELERLREQILRVEKLSTVGILAAGIAHEVGTPLGIIRGRAEYAMYKLGDDHPQAEGLAIIIDQIDRVVRIIRGLLDFSSPRTVAAGAVDVGQAVRRAVDLVQVEADRRDVEIVESADGVPPIAADPDQLQQVLVNLLMNALDACSAGGRIALAASADDPGWVRLQVRDSGTGIASVDLHRIFDPFYTTKKRGQGTGLGLAIVNQVVRDHGGRITVQSEPGSGTVFEIVLPTRAPERIGSSVERTVA